MGIKHMKVLRKFGTAIAIAGLCVGASTSARADIELNIGETLSATLSTADSPAGIVATDGWDSQGATLVSSVQRLDFMTWHYTYTWTTKTKGLSHIIIEVTEGAIAGDFENFNVNGTYTSPTLFAEDLQGNSNPGMPAGTIFGIKVNTPEGTDLINYTFSFDSHHAPVWGDFYAKDGVEKTGGEKVDVYAYNAGFDGNAGPSGDSKVGDGLHAIVPNGLAVVPEPSTVIAGALLLLPFGASAIRIIRRKKA